VIRTELQKQLIILNFIRAVVLAEGPHKYTRGTFLSLKEDVEWAAIRESNGAVNSHPVEWLRSDGERE